MNEIEELIARKQELLDQFGSVEAKAKDEDRDLVDLEINEMDRLLAEADKTQRLIDQKEKKAKLENMAAQSQGRKAEPTGGALQVRDGARVAIGDHNSRRDGKWGFNNLGEFALTVKSRPDDIRLKNALTTYGTEGVGADGSFAVPPEFRSAIQTLVLGEDTLLSRCDAIPTNSNMVIVPTDEDTAWGTSGGVRVYRRAEAGTMTQSKPALKEITVRVEEMYALVPVTDQLLEDAPMLSRFLSNKAGEKINYKINDEIINGTGSQGQMLGILKSPCLVTVSKESNQAADTVVSANILKMYSRMPDAVRRNAVWLINQDIEPQLLSINLEYKSSAGAAIAAGTSGLVPEGGLRYDPTNGMLMGRPIIATEACATIGDVGDIILAYLPGYFAPYKAGGVKEAVSIHLHFDQGTTTYRWTFRIGGQPWLSSAISRAKGSNTLSHFVTLEAR